MPREEFPAFFSDRSIPCWMPWGEPRASVVAQAPFVIVVVDKLDHSARITGCQVRFTADGQVVEAVISDRPARFRSSSFHRGCHHPKGSACRASDQLWRGPQRAAAFRHRVTLPHWKRYGHDRSESLGPTNMAVVL
jgi:hypothetical protein